MRSQFLSVLALSFLLVGCANVAPQGGMLFHDIKYGIDATSVDEAPKRGEACQSSVLFLVGSGDASVEAAKRNAGISKVATVDASSFSVLGFYNKYCTIVTGN